ncbi:putative membrane protein [Piscirickettsia salmonis LF-89 = ATCC VR-1361]|nr:putative membrane protein [Piscirickettsia salmonis LF-89 = ATCC VR-1361]
MPTFFKGFVGGLWGLVDGFIGGVIIAMIYNWVVCRPINEE